MRFNKVIFFAIIPALILGITGCTSSKKDMLIINEDDSHFYFLSGNLSQDEYTEDFIRKYIGRFKGTKLTHFFMCPNAQRAAFKSKVKQAIWEPVLDPKNENNSSESKPAKLTNWQRAAKTFHDKNLDVYKIWIDECRRIGVSPWISMRMNDIHFPFKRDYFGHDAFWLKHPEFQRMPKEKTNKRWESWALNYKHKEVRDYQMAFLRELFERYDFDGIELDWMRFCLHLTPYKGEEESHILTDFMREAKELAREFEKKRGHKIQIAVKVLATPDAAKFIGLDVVEWANKDFVDLIVPTGNWATTDYDIPVNSWKDALGENAKKVKVIAGVEDGNSVAPGGKRAPVDLYSLNGFAVNSYYNGSDGVYLFNIINHPDLIDAAMKQNLDEITTREKVRRHIVTYRNLPEYRDRKDMLIQLPRKIDKPCEFKVQVGALPASFKNDEVFAIIGVMENDKFKEAEFKVSLNGVVATSAIDEENTKYYGISRDGKGRAIKCAFPSSAIKAGYNIVKIEKAKESDISQTIGWVEINVVP